MSALVMADEVARFNEGERVNARLYAFLSLFLWPLSSVALWLAAMLAVMLVGLDGQSWLLRLVWIALLIGLVASLRPQLRRLRRADAALDEFYTSTAAVDPLAAASAANAADAAIAAAQAGTARPAAPALPDPGAGEGPPPILRLAAGLGYLLLAAPRCAAKAAFSFRRAISWDAAQLAAGQALFEALGATGGAWVACSAHPGSGALMAGLERLELVEHRIGSGREIRLHPDIRRRYFPKDPSQAMYAGPPRRS